MTTRTQSHFIRGEEVVAAPGWDFGAMDKPSSRFAAKLKAQALAEGPKESDIVRQAGFADGYAQGFAQGQAQATLLGQHQISEYITTQGAQAQHTFESIFAQATTQLQEQEQVMSKGVLELACELARQVLRHELSANPNALLPVIKEALGMLSVDSKAAVVRLNPQDADVFRQELTPDARQDARPDVRQDISPELSAKSLTVVADPLVSRGGCLVESAGTVIDGTVEKRWMRAVATLGLDSAWDTPDEQR
jgi:flagellar assembly protein FliH